MDTVTLEIPAECEPLVRRVLALQEELHALALTAPEGTVLDACEALVVPKSRALAQQLLAEAVAQRVQSAEKKGPPSAPAPVAEPNRTVERRRGSSSRRSAS
jgi:hypothetical protein